MTLEEVAALGIKVDATEATKAVGELEALTAAGARTEAQAERVATSSRSSSQALATMARSAMQGGQAGQVLQSSLQQTASAANAATAGLDRQTAAIARAGAEARLAATSSKALQNATLNLSRQFTDVGVQLASGQSPFLILIQQGPQIADAFAMAKTQGLGFGDVVKGIGASVAPLAPLLIGVGAAVGAAVGGFALFERAVDQNTKHATTWGDTWKATVKVIGDAIMKGPIGDGLRWLGHAFSATLNAITQGALWALDKTVGFFGAAYEMIVKNWRQLPQVFAAIFQSAANAAIQGVEAIVNKTIDGLNVLLKAAGKQTIGHIDLPEIHVANAKIAADFEATANRISAGFKKSREGLFKDIVAQADKEWEARQKAGKAAKDHAAATNEHADALARDIQRTTEYIAKLTQERDQIGLTKQQLDRLNDSREIELALKRGDLASAQRIHDLRLEIETLNDLADALKEIKDVEKELTKTVDFIRTPKDLEGITPKVRSLTDEVDKLTEAWLSVGRAFDNVMGDFKSGDLSSIIRDVIQLKDQLTGVYNNAGGGIGGFAATAGSLAGAVAPYTSGRTQTALNGASLGSQAGMLLGGPIGAVVGTIVGALGGYFLGNKPSNQGAGYDLVTGQLSGSKRTSETEQAVKAAGQAILTGQEVLKSYGLTLTDSIRGLVVGSRDLSQIYTASGKTLTSAVGDVQAAADTALKALIGSATFASEAQRQVAEKAVAAGKSFDDVVAVLEAFSQAQNLGQGIADAIQQLRDPKAYDLAQVDRAIADQRKQLQAAADAGYITASTLTDLNAQLDTLRGLQIDEVMKRYGDAVQDAAKAAEDMAASAKSFTDGIFDLANKRQRLMVDLLNAQGDTAGATALGRSLDLQGVDPSLRDLQSSIWAVQDASKALTDAYNAQKSALEATKQKFQGFAESLKALGSELVAQAAQVASPLAAYRQARAAFNATSAGVDRGEEAALAAVDSVGKAYIEAAKAVAPDQRTVALAISQVRDLAKRGQTYAEKQVDAADASLKLLEQQVGSLISIDTGTKDVATAIRELQAALTTARAASGGGSATLPGMGTGTGVNYGAITGSYNGVSNAQIVQSGQAGGFGGGFWDSAIGALFPGSNSTGGLPHIRGYASGGDHMGGLRFVGERGVELEATGPARIWNASQTRQMLAGDNGETAAEIRALRNQVARLEAALIAVATNTGEQKRLLKRWDGDGMPETRDTSEAA